MFPIGDDDSHVRITPIVTYTLIAINVAVFMLQVSQGNAFTTEWAFVPGRFTQNPAGDAQTLLYAMFMHGSWMHLGGNMLYLWIFGNNIEDRFGHVPFLLFYLVSGLLATFAQYFVMPNSMVPNVGASGAIAGVLGAYLLLFPRKQVQVAIGYAVMPMPALIVIGFWIVLQLFSGVGSIAYTDETSDQGGVAYMAHVGGFFAGLALAFLMRRRGPSHTA